MGPKNGGFWENGGWNLRFWFCDSQKALPCAEPRRLTRNRVVWRILRQNRCSRLGCSISRTPKIAESLCAEGREITHAQNRNPWTDLDKILHGRRYHQHSYPHKFWWPSVQGFFLAARCQISPSPIDFHRRPYNTLASASVWLLLKYTISQLSVSRLSHLLLQMTDWSIARYGTHWQSRIYTILDTELPWATKTEMS